MKDEIEVEIRTQICTNIEILRPTKPDIGLNLLCLTKPNKVGQCFVICGEDTSAQWSVANTID